MSATLRISLRIFALLAAVLAGALGAQHLGLGYRPFAATSPAPYATVEQAQYAEAIARAREVAQEILGRGAPGVSVAVAVDGDIAWSEGFGFADLEHRVPVWPATRFRVGSISKPLTAAAVARLVEQGKLDLDAPVQRYVPSFPEKGQPITTRLLAGHLAGIRHYRGAEFLINRPYATVTESLAIFKDDPLVFEPGTRYSYSSYGWNLISAVVEGAAGTDFLSYMDAEVFAPLGLRHTVADRNTPIIPQRVRFYARDRDGKLVNAPYVDNSYKWAGGGFLSTAEDLVRFGSAHLEPGFLRQQTIDLLWTSQRLKSGEETKYGIGWRTELDGKGRRLVSHTGGSVGGTSVLAIYPERKVVVAILVNLSGAQLRPADVERIADAFRP